MLVRVEQSLEAMHKKLNEILEILKKKDDLGYYMYVAMQPAPVIHGAMMTSLASKQQVALIKETLSAQKDSWIQNRNYPIQFAVLSSTVAADLRRGAFSLVWSGLGCGWDATTNLPQNRSTTSGSSARCRLDADILVKGIRKLQTKPSKHLKFA